MRFYANVSRIRKGSVRSGGGTGKADWRKIGRTFENCAETSRIKYQRGTIETDISQKGTGHF